MRRIRDTKWETTGAEDPSIVPETDLIAGSSVSADVHS